MHLLLWLSTGVLGLGGELLLLWVYRFGLVLWLVL